MSRLEEFAKGQEVKVFPSGREAEIAEQKTGKREPKYKRFLRKVAMMTTGLALINATLIGTPAFAQQQDNVKEVPTLNLEVKGKYSNTEAYYAEVAMRNYGHKLGVIGEIQKGRKEQVKPMHPFKDLMIEGTAKEEIEELSYALLSLSNSRTGAILLKNAVDNGYKFGMLTKEDKENDDKGSIPYARTDPENKQIRMRTIEDRKKDLIATPAKDKTGKDKGYNEYATYLLVKSINPEDQSKIKKKLDNRSNEEKNLTAEQVWDLAHELRHVWQVTHDMPYYYFSREKDEQGNLQAYSVKDMINISRSREADAEAIATLVCWELYSYQRNNKEDLLVYELDRSFELMKRKETRNAPAIAFEKVVGEDKEAIINNEKLEKATNAAFEAWHDGVYSRSGELLKYAYDFKVLDDFGKSKEGENNCPDYNWNFNRQFNEVEQLNKFTLPFTKFPYVKDFYFKGLKEEHEKALDKWFENRKKETQKEPDKSYILEDEIERKSIPSKKEQGALLQDNKSQQKLAQQAYDNRINHILKMRKNGRV